MGKFSFISGRKKPPSPPLPDLQPMSKAHKILGSTPLNIDSPVFPDNNSTQRDLQSRGAASEHGFLDGLVSAPRLRDEWDAGLGSQPSGHMLKAMVNGSSVAETQSKGGVKILQTASTSALDNAKSKHRRSLSRRSSNPQMSRSLALRSHPVFESKRNISSPGSKKKPPMLDFSNLRSSSRLSRKVSNSQLNTGNSVQSQLGQPESLLSPFSIASSKKHGDKRSLLKRRTKDSFRSIAPTEVTTAPPRSGSAQNSASDNRLSTLYDHYEKNSFRQIMKQDLESQDMPSIATAVSEAPGEAVEWREATTEDDLEWLHKPLPDAPLATLGKDSTPSLSPGDGSRSISSKYTQTSAASKRTDHSPRDADFHDKSVLLLSDSEDEDESHQTKSKRTSSTKRSSSFYGTTSYTDDGSDSAKVRRSLERPASKHSSKGSSNCRPNTYITIPSEETNHPSPRLIVDSFRIPSPRESLSSTNSTASGMTCRLGYGMQDSPIVTVLPARRPSQAEQEAASIRARDSVRDSVRNLAPHDQGSSSTDQITPPLSPSSVDFYLRSARSSVDEGSGRHSRIMALSRQEQMLISALRTKNQKMRDRARFELDVQSMHIRRPSKGRGSNASQATITQATTTFDFGFPAPPNFNMKTQRGSEATIRLAESEKPILPTEAASNEKTNTTSEQLENSSQISSIITGRQVVPVFLDASRPTSTWGDGEDEEDELDEASGITADFLPISWGQPSEIQLHEDGKESVEPADRPQSTYVQNGLSCPLTNRLMTLAEEEADDVPRPDSPISPDSFPDVPSNRVKMTNLARLSAVGWSRPANEMGWWGDDD